MEEKFNQLKDYEKADEILNKGILYADAFINKNYLINLNYYPIIPLEEDCKKDNYLRLFKVQRVVYDVDELSNDKLISVYSALSNIGSTAVLIISSDKKGIDFYIGIRSEENAVTSGMILEKSIKGNFPGSRIIPIINSEIKNILNPIVEMDDYNNYKKVASVSIVPSERDNDKKNFIQGIEKFIDSMIGENYTAIFISTPLNKEILEQRKRGLMNLYSNLSSFSSTQLSYSENESTSIAEGLSNNFSNSLNASLTDTNSSSETKSMTYTKQKGRGHSYGFLGRGFNKNISESLSQGYSTGNTWSKAVTAGATSTVGSTDSYTDTKTEGTTKTMTITYENKVVKVIMEKIEEHLKRIKRCEAFGLWDCACYFISDDIQTSVVAANTYKALMAGEGSGVENSFINIWGHRAEDDSKGILEYLRYCRHPQIKIPENNDIFGVDEQIVTTASLISGQEIPIIMGLPKKSVSGVTALSMVEFGRNLLIENKNSTCREIDIGTVYHMGEKENNRVILDLDSLTAHCFITGSTGSGKSNTTYKILDELIKVNIPFLVVEPAKGEYKRKFSSLEGLNIFCTNPKYFSMLKINPFKFNSEIHILEHLDRMIEIFNACWPLYAAMPAILKQAFEEAYVRCGWDLKKSIYLSNGRNKYPTFQDVLEILPLVIESSSYSSDAKGDYIGALVTRVNSLTNGILGQIFCDSADISDMTLFNENTIIDLSRIASLETKSLIMGILVLKLNEFRMSEGLENQLLRHITILEEAHNLLKRTGTVFGGQESADLQGKSVEMISSSIAEMRTFGEGFIIVDQSPTAVDVSAIKNTNTKIIMRLPDYEDCTIAGKALALEEKQIKEIAKFPMGVAAIYQNNWLEAILTKIDKSESSNYREDCICTNDEIAEIKGLITTILIKNYEENNLIQEKFDRWELLDIIRNYEISKYKKQEIMREIIEIFDYFINVNIDNESFADQLFKFVDCDGLFRLFKLELNNDYSNNEEITRFSIKEDDEQVIDNWYNEIFNNIDNYVELEDIEIKKLMVKILIFNKWIEEKNTNRYTVTYSYLYGEN